MIKRKFKEIINKTFAGKVIKLYKDVNDIRNSWPRLINTIITLQMITSGNRFVIEQLIHDYNIMINEDEIDDDTVIVNFDGSKDDKNILN